MTVENRIRYRRGLKYQLEEDVVFHTGITGWAYRDKWSELDNAGTLLIRAGTAWDGPSGPTFDTPDFMPASLGHDEMYKASTERGYPEVFRQLADNFLAWRLKEDAKIVNARIKNPVLRALRCTWSVARVRYVLWAVRRFAASHAKRQEPEILEAP
jgi:hypothetical protein